MKNKVNPHKKKDIYRTYDGLKIPPNVDQAMVHFKASKIGRESNQRGSDKICPCCLKTIKKDFSILKDGINIASYGSTIPLYIQFTNFVLGFFFILMLGSAFFTWKMTLLNYRFSKSKPKNEMNLFNAGNQTNQTNVTGYALVYDYNYGFFDKKRKEIETVLYYNVYFDILTSIGLILLAMYYQYSFERFAQKKKNQMRISAEDFTVMIGNVNETDRISDIQKFINRVTSLNGLPPPRIVNMTIASFKGNIKILNGKIEELQEQIQAVKKCLKERLLALSHRKQKIALSVIKDKEEEIKDCEKQISKFLIKHLNMEANDEHCVAFITFATTIEKDWLLYCRQMIKPWFFRCLKKKKKYKILAASSPDDINWECIGYPTWERKKSMIIVWITVMISFILFVILISGLEALRESLVRDNNKGFINDIFFGIMFLPLMVAIITQIYIQIMEYFAKFYKYLSKNDYLIGASIRLILIYLVTYIISQGVYFFFEIQNSSNIQKKPNKDSLLNRINIVRVETFNFFLMEIFIIPLGNIINPEYYLELFCLWRVRKQLRTKTVFSTKYHWMTQKELHEMHERLQCELEFMYSDIIGPLLIIAAMTPLVRILPLIGIVFLLIQRFFDKLQLYKRYKSPPENSNFFSKKMMNLICWVPKIYIVAATFHFYFLQRLIKDLPPLKKGNFAASSQTNHFNLLLPSLIFLPFLYIYLIIPFHGMFEKQMKKKFAPFQRENIKLGKFIRRLINNKILERSPELDDKHSDYMRLSTIADYKYRSCKHRNYNDIKHLLSTDYDRMNPATHNEAEENWKHHYLKISEILNPQETEDDEAKKRKKKRRRRKKGKSAKKGQKGLRGEGGRVTGVGMNDGKKKGDRALSDLRKDLLP